MTKPGSSHNNSLNQRIRDALAERDLKLCQVAARLDMHPSNLTLRLRGDTPWRLPELHVLAHLFEIPLSRLVSDENGDEA